MLFKYTCHVITKTVDSYQRIYAYSGYSTDHEVGGVYHIFEDTRTNTYLTSVADGEPTINMHSRTHAVWLSLQNVWWDQPISHSFQNASLFSWFRRFK